MTIDVTGKTCYTKETGGTLATLLVQYGPLSFLMFFIGYFCK